ncbi:putative thiosulfate sulfurtransferase [bacterium BMS3Abin07]|nr:putative thiosulfate sulfurtransferase [bacterium BMS3Abin07]GBE32713.1 putative thiosulfate sulfurtransferase [bacterium BMS3Bbin05]
MAKKILLIAVAVFFLLSSAGLVSAAQWANPGLLVNAETVAKNITRPNWVVVDCRDLKKYVKGHIPGAISLGKRCKKALRDSTARVWRNTSKYEKLFGKAGIGNNTHVVFYHGGIKDFPDATVAFWVMEYLGHKKVHVLNGGIDAWRSAGHRLDKKPVRKAPKTFTAKVNHKLYASTDEILKIAKGKIKNEQLIDSRTHKEYIGKDCRAIRCGHVPNVITNVSHLDTVVRKADSKKKLQPTGYLSPDVLAKKFGKLNKNKRTIAYCQTGTRSTLTYLELRLMGFKNPANWDDSWRVWGTHYADYPVEAPNGEQFYNFAKVNKTLKKLKKKVAKLEKALKGKGKK